MKRTRLPLLVTYFVAVSGFADNSGLGDAAASALTGVGPGEVDELEDEEAG